MYQSHGWYGNSFVGVFLSWPDMKLPGLTTEFTSSWRGIFESKNLGHGGCYRKDQRPICMSFAPVCGSEICRASAVLLFFEVDSWWMMDTLSTFYHGNAKSHIKGNKYWRDQLSTSMFVGGRVTAWEFEFLWLLLFLPSACCHVICQCWYAAYNSAGDVNRFWWLKLHINSVQHIL